MALRRSSEIQSARCSTPLRGRARTTFTARPLLLPPDGFQRPAETAGAYGGDSRGKRRFLRGGCGRAADSRQAVLLRSVRTREARPAAPVTVPRGNHRAARIAGRLRQRRFHSGRACTSIWRRRDWLITSRHRVSARYMHHANDSPYNNSTIGGLFLVSQCYNFVDRSHVGAVQLVSTLSSHAVNELRGQVAYRGQENDTFAEAGTGPAITVSGVANFGGPTAGGIRLSRRRRRRLTDTFSSIRGVARVQVRRQPARGSATRRWRSSRPLTLSPHCGVPGSHERAATRRVTAPSRRLWETQRSTTTRCSAAGLRRIAGSRCRNLTLTYGLRYDVYRCRRPNKTSPFAYSQNFRVDKNNFAPRLGLAWALGKDQKTVIRASTRLLL